MCVLVLVVVSFETLIHSIGSPDTENICHLHVTFLHWKVDFENFQMVIKKLQLILMQVFVY